MVGTKPMMRLSARAWRAACFIQAMVRMVSTEARTLRFGGDVALAIKMHQVGQDGLRAVLAQHRRDLAAVICAVIYNVLHGLPQRIAVDAELQRFVFQYPVKIALRQAANEIEQARLEFAPALAKGGHVRILLGIRERGWRAALETFQPDPFGAEDVRQRVAHGRKTRAHRLGELLRSERDCRGQRAAIRPSIVFIEMAHFFRGHGTPSQLSSASRLNKSKCELDRSYRPCSRNRNDRTRGRTGSCRCVHRRSTYVRRWRLLRRRWRICARISEFGRR